MRVLLVKPANALHTREYSVQKVSCTFLPFLHVNLVHVLLHAGGKLERKPVIASRRRSQHLSHLALRLPLS